MASLHRIPRCNRQILQEIRGQHVQWHIRQLLLRDHLARDAFGALLRVTPRWTR